VRAGADVIVAGTSVFKQLDLAYAVSNLRDNAREALAYLEEPPAEESGENVSV
jgi:hypothetical protein